MDTAYALLLGIIQGITEWLPISSTAHLAIANRFLGIDQSSGTAFDIALHAGTLLSVVAVFWKDLLEMVKAAIRLDGKSPAGKTLILLVIATVPGALAGILFNNYIEGLFDSILLIGAALIINSVILYAASAGRGIKQIGKREAAITGLVQAAALIPGISRSGSTISAAMISGVERNKAAYFSLLMSIPITFGAAVFELRKAALIELQPAPTVAGIAAAAAVGYVSIKVLLRIVRESKLQYFAYYCLLAGASCVIAALFFDVR